jgi:hypothetical protein
MSCFEVGERSSTTSPQFTPADTPFLNITLHEATHRIYLRHTVESRSDHAPKRKNHLRITGDSCKNLLHPEIQAYTSRSIEGDLCLGRGSLKLNGPVVHGLIVFLFLTESAEASCEEIFKKWCCWATREVAINETMS